MVVGTGRVGTKGATCEAECSVQIAAELRFRRTSTLSFGPWEDNDCDFWDSALDQRPHVRRARSGLVDVIL